MQEFTREDLAMNYAHFTSLGDEDSEAMEDDEDDEDDEDSKDSDAKEKASSTAKTTTCSGGTMLFVRYLTQR